MSNAWSHYVGPLGVSAAFAITGIMCLIHFAWGRRDAGGKRSRLPSALVGGLFGLGIGGVVGLPILLNSPTPAERERFFDRAFRTPPERIERFVIKGGDPQKQYKPLTAVDVVIDDPACIRRISDLLRSATARSPNHPQARWTADIEMVTREGTLRFGITATVPGNPNGTLVRPAFEDHGRWNLGAWKADRLDEALEEAVNAARKP